MAKNIPNVDLLTETFETWLNRTNSVITALGSEVITANTSLGVTGAPTVPLNSRLFGTFTANNLVATTALSVPNSFAANSSTVSINSNLLLNGVAGANAQILASNGSSLYWTTLQIDTASNSGLEGGPITSSGSLRVKAGAGVRLNANGVTLDLDYIQSNISSAPTLAGSTWQAPAAIGSTTPNLGTFTTLTANNYRISGVSTDNFLIDGSVIRVNGQVDSTTPGNGVDDLRGGVRVRARGTGRGVIQFTNQTATSTYGSLTVDSSNVMRYSNLFQANGFILSDEGDIVDFNDGYASIRFGSGVSVYSGNRTGSSVIKLRSNGNIEAAGSIQANGQISSGGSNVLTLADFTKGGTSTGWTRLPNGLILQYGSATSFAETTTTVTYPTAFSSFSIAVLSGGEGGAGAQDNNPYVTSAGTSSFTMFSARGISATVWWIAIGY